MVFQSYCIITQLQQQQQKHYKDQWQPQALLWDRLQCLLDGWSHSCTPTSHNPIRLSVYACAALYNLVTPWVHAPVLDSLEPQTKRSYSFSSASIPQFILRVCLIFFLLSNCFKRVKSWKLKIYIIIGLATVAQYKWPHLHSCVLMLKNALTSKVPAGSQTHSCKLVLAHTYT